MAPPRPLVPEQRAAVESIAAMMSSADSLPNSHQVALAAMRSALVQLREIELNEDENVDNAFESIEGATGGMVALKQLVHGVETRTLTIFSLANHMSSESVLLGIDPESLFQTFAGLSKAAEDLEFARKVMFSSVPLDGGVGGSQRKGLRRMTIGPRRLSQVG